MQIRVYYEDTDVGGVVYHSNYLNFCERARSQLFFDAGRSPILEGGHFVAKHIEADYLKSAKFGEILEVKTTLIQIKNASFSLLQQIFREDEKIFEMKIDLVYINFAGNMTKIPAAEKAFLSALE
ncbi:YbgC/FadM family acyl-CoA thioesterase [Sulfuricurvum sp. RIFCSPLOWO2_12_FULL_43_24]|uniref:YbgC/FadM family acyl-CoA thioesterase n=1 Tax=Sulfuricurvum sp. RIFCSPLOWO2_12_FULL_43_24 TaxID=1802247 RepID=UPI0008CAB17F|nr:YbgC/FadM family acyl-CoA thioesterase [Sulfuricurvum sp. RIFCSPLOWO2_12_FULL_43_24]OHD89436.1 MAG: acyl-CoA thioester hydrolase [Sulfuricurvum sp. RIFCSPLOWO2_12_FULL_43_24]